MQWLREAIRAPTPSSCARSLVCGIPPTFLEVKEVVRETGRCLQKESELSRHPFQVPTALMGQISHRVSSG